MELFSKLYVSFPLILSLIVSFVPVVSAQGFNLFNVINGSTSINLDPVFPGAGTVLSDGVTFPGLGNFTTGLERLEEIPFLSLGQTVSVPIEWFAENSISINPVNRSVFGLGTGLADFHTIINRRGLFPQLPNTDGLVSSSVGSITITRITNNGGTFSLHLDINPLIVLTTVGGSVSDLTSPDVLLVLNGTGLLNPVGSLGGQWSETPPSNTIVNPEFPARGFYAAVDPITVAPSIVNLTSGGIEAARNVTIAQAVPEPLTILGSATALGFGGFLKRKLKPSKSSEKEITKVG